MDLHVEEDHSHAENHIQTIMTQTFHMTLKNAADTEYAEHTHFFILREIKEWQIL